MSLIEVFSWTCYVLIAVLSVLCLFLLNRYWIYLKVCEMYQHIPGHCQFFPPQLAAVLPRWMLPHGTCKSMGDFLTPAGEQRFITQAGKPYFKIVFGFMSHGLVIVDHPDMGKEIVSKPKIYKKERNANVYMTELFGASNIIMEDDHRKWQHLRQLLDPCFVPSFLKVVTDTTNQVLREDMIPCIEKQLSERDLLKDTSRLAMDVFGMVGFSYNFGSFQVSEQDTEAPVNKVQKLMSTIEVLRVLPYSFIRKYCRIGIIATMYDAIDAMVDQVKKAIHKRESVGYINNDNDDILNLLLKNRKENEQINGQLSNNSLISNLFMFYLAGHETTGKSIAFAIYNLAKHPEIQQFVYNELAKFEEDFFDHSHFTSGKLDVVRAVFRESLRLYPVAFGLMREIAKTSKWNDLTLPKETLLLYSWNLTHRNEEYWGKSAGKFNPHRFLNENLQICDPHPNNPFVYSPFGIGQRRCIANMFAEIEACHALATLIKKYEFRLTDPNHQIKLDTSVALTPSEPLPIEIIKRESNK